MRFGCAFVGVALVACESATEPPPPDGTYVLVQASAWAEVGRAQTQWMELPFDYDITGNFSCVYRVRAGHLSISGADYSLTLEQDVVYCPARYPEPVIQESGTLTMSRSEGGAAYGLTFVAGPPRGWLDGGEFRAGELVVEFVVPIGGRINSLKFRKPS